jgi:hypothetical protein
VEVRAELDECALASFDVRGALFLIQVMCQKTKRKKEKEKKE